MILSADVKKFYDEETMYKYKNLNQRKIIKTMSQWKAVKNV